MNEDEQTKFLLQRQREQRLEWEKQQGGIQTIADKIEAIGSGLSTSPFDDMTELVTLLADIERGMRLDYAAERRALSVTRFALERIRLRMRPSGTG